MTADPCGAKRQEHLHVCTRATLHDGVHLCECGHTWETYRGR